MKKRIFCVILAAALLFALFGISASAADYRITCIAVNDMLPSELVNVVSSYNGSTFVPGWLFTNYLGFSLVYSSSAGAAYLYTASNGLTFDLNTGKCTDDDGYVYSARAIIRNGTVYLPLDFVQAFFASFSYSLVTENSHGDVIRIKTGSEVLTDAEFISAAKSLIYQYWQKSAPPGASPAPSPPEETLPPNVHEGTEVHICFAGLPDSSVFGALSAKGVRACFFLTAEDVRNNADTIRRIVCEGHSVGVYCMEELEAEFEETSSLIFDAARVRTLLVFSAEDVDTSGAEALGVRLCGAELDFSLADTGGSYSSIAYGITGRLEKDFDGGSLFLPASIPLRSLNLILTYLSEGKFATPLLREAQ